MDTIDNTLPNNPNTPLFKSALEYGLILSLIGIGIMLIAHYSGIDMNGTMWKSTNWVISAIMVAWMLWHFREKKNGGFLRYGQGVGLSTLTGLISGIIGGIFFFIFVKYLAPEFIENIENKAISDMQAQGLSDDQISQSMQYARMFMSPGAMVVYAILGAVVSYLILGLIFSAIFKRD